MKRKTERTTSPRRGIHPPPIDKSKPSEKTHYHAEHSHELGQLKSQERLSKKRIYQVHGSVSKKTKLPQTQVPAHERFFKS